jgi:hypothetical protein
MPPLAGLLFQKFLDLNGSHTAGSGRSDRLPVAAVLHVATGVYAMNASHYVVMSFDISVGIGVEMPGKHFRVGVVADTQEQRTRREVGHYSGFDITQLKARNFVVCGVVDILDNRIGKKMNLGVLLCPFEHDLRGAKVLAAMNERNLCREASQEDRLFHGRVSAPDDDDFFAREKKSVAGRARRNAMANELLLVGQSEPACRRAAGDDERLCVHLVLAEMKQERTLAEIHAGEVRHAIFRPEPFGLFAHVIDQLRPHDAFGKTGKVLDQRGERQLAAGFVALDDERFQVGARSVKRGSVPGAAGSDDDDVARFAHKNLVISR